MLSLLSKQSRCAGERSKADEQRLSMVARAMIVLGDGSDPGLKPIPCSAENAVQPECAESTCLRRADPEGVKFPIMAMPLDVFWIGR